MPDRSALHKERKEILASPTTEQQHALLRGEESISLVRGRPEIYGMVWIAVFSVEEEK